MKRNANDMKALRRRVIQHAGGELRYRLASASMTGRVDEVLRLIGNEREELAEVVWQNCCSANVCKLLQARGLPLTDISGLSLVITDDEVSDYLLQGGMSPINSISIMGKILRDAEWKERKMEDLQAHFEEWKTFLKQALRHGGNLPDDVIGAVCKYLV
jgi:hypothetical protein